MTEEDVIKKYSCPVCFEILKKPASIPCGHIYCITCLTSYMTKNSAGNCFTCPVCRKGFERSGIRLAADLERAMTTEVVKCMDCHQQMYLTTYNSHVKVCKGTKPMDVTFKPVARSSQPVPRNLPNRSTFTCPLCPERNLDCLELVKHTLECHGHERPSVTCPICASMPWGNPDQKSNDYVSHVALRHQFEYDTYVDYEQDDESALQAAIQASLRSH